MNIKVKHRLLGMLVIAGLVVIILPFLQSGHELSPETTTIKEPAFPDQAVQLTTSTEEQEAKPPQIAETKEPVPTPTATPAATPTVGTTDATPVPVPTLDATSDSKTTKIEKKPETKDVSSENTTTHKPLIQAAKKSSKKANFHLGAKQTKKTHHLTREIKNNDLFNIQDPAWVIQVGSFDNKAKALKVVNHLRANGYRAFIQQFSDNTQVFVGPQNKQADARRLSQELKSHMHLHGIVISYQPLAV